jgi:hypothetical protein
MYVVYFKILRYLKHNGTPTNLLVPLLLLYYKFSETIVFLDTETLLLGQMPLIR